MSSTAETRYDRLLQWQRGETPGPWTMSLYPTYRCNIQCKICWKREFEEPLTAKEELPSDRLIEIADEAAELGVREWIVGGGGELMLRGKAVMKFLKRIRSHGMNGLVQTNATRWTEKNLHELVDMGWEKFTVSLDGPTKEINDANRIEKNFDKAVDTIRKLQQIKKEKGAQFPLINLISVITNQNYRSLKGMVDLSQKLELSPGSLSAVDLIVYGDHDKQYLLNDQQREELVQHVNETIEYADSIGVSHGYRTYLHALDEGRLLNAHDLFTEPEESVSAKTMCFEPFLHMLMLPEGNSGPCCTYHDPDKNDNVWNTPLKDVWMGPYMQHVRQMILSGKTPDYCNECMITRIQENRNIQSHFAHIEASMNSSEPVSFGELLEKASGSLKKNGLAGSIKRGREWLQLRNEGKKHRETIEQ